MLKIDEYRERYNNVQDDKIRKYLKANPVRKLVDFEDSDNQDIEFTSYFHQFLMERTGTCEDEMIVEYIECDSWFLNGVDLSDAGQRKYFLLQV